MPTYEYECTHCGHTFEAFQKMSDEALDVCPQCNNKVRRLIAGGTGIIFKGSGFYATDYRKSPAKEPVESKPAVCPKAQEGCTGCSHQGH
ncbi:MAG: FmdB family zinc ribbon protein [Candidatus Omnitrophota bacterium]